MDFPDCPESQYGQCPTRCPSARCAETLGRTRAAYTGVSARTPWPRRRGISDSEAVSDGDDEHCETEMMVVNAMRLRVPAWQRGLLCSRAGSKEQPTARGGGHLQGAPSVPEFMTYQLKRSWSTAVGKFSKSKHASCNFGTRGWTAPCVLGGEVEWMATITTHPSLKQRCRMLGHSCRGSPPKHTASWNGLTLPSAPCGQMWGIPGYCE